MRKSLLVIFLLLFVSTLVFAAEITGDYVETRSADVYTGQCFANGEVNLMGDEAILGWHIARGSWQGVALDGLNVAAVVKARATLGDPYTDPYPAKSVLIVDEQANARQRRALIDFAHHMGGKLVANVVRVEYAPVELAVRHDAHGAALLRAGNIATVQTRALNDADHVCGNEVTFYPPLTRLAHSMPAVALTDQYRGRELGVSWETHGKRSAFVGMFREPAPVLNARNAGD